MRVTIEGSVYFESMLLWCYFVTFTVNKNAYINKNKKNILQNQTKVVTAKNESWLNTMLKWNFKLFTCQA